MNPHNNNRPTSPNRSLPPAKFATRPMKPKPDPDPQDTFIAQLVASKALCSIVTIGGQTLVGKIVAHGRYTDTLAAQNGTQPVLVYKSSISTVSPKVAVPAATGATA
jgi:sRNA-binding regulator protein Hfq